MSNPKISKHSIVLSLSEDQIFLLKQILEERCWEFSEAPYCHFKAGSNKVSIAAYQSGKTVIQGKNAAETMEFIVEPMILKNCEYTREKMLHADKEEDNGENTVFTAHAGIDESGKGDFFGPLVICCAYVPDAETARQLSQLGVRDSKQIKSENVMIKTAGKIRRILKNRYALVAIGNEAYNRLYANIGSLNRLLAWGHARALENLLQNVPECNHALADKFGDESLIKRALMQAGKQIELRQQTKAEQDIAVATASILARAEFVTRLKNLSAEMDTVLPKGAGTQVDIIAAELAAKGGEKLLGQCAKMHFRTADKALGRNTADPDQ